MRTSDASPSKHGMRRGHACDVSRAMTALNPFATAAIAPLCAAGSPHMAQAAEPDTLTLACPGTATDAIVPGSARRQHTCCLLSLEREFGTFRPRGSF